MAWAHDYRPNDCDIQSRLDMAIKSMDILSSLLLAIMHFIGDHALYYFCNSLLFGLPSQQIQRLQLIQNSAARLVTRTKKHDSISSVLRNLHWLPIQSRINFKVLLFAYQCFHQFGPSYLVELLTQYKPERTLRSSKKSLFCVPQTMTRSYGERSFSYAAPVLWNNLPEHVRNIDTYERFKTSLKTHLFNTSYMS